MSYHLTLTPGHRYLYEDDAYTDRVAVPHLHPRRVQAPTTVLVTLRGVESRRRRAYALGHNAWRTEWWAVIELPDGLVRFVPAERLMHPARCDIGHIL